MKTVYGNKRHREKEECFCVEHASSCFRKDGFRNFFKIAHTSTLYGDMQLISEAYPVLKSIGKLANDVPQKVFFGWNKSELLNFSVKITAVFGIDGVKTSCSTRSWMS